METPVPQEINDLKQLYTEVTAHINERFRELHTDFNELKTAVDKLTAKQEESTLNTIKLQTQFDEYKKHAAEKDAEYDKRHEKDHAEIERKIEIIHECRRKDKEEYDKKLEKSGENTLTAAKLWVIIGAATILSSVVAFFLAYFFNQAVIK